MKRYALFAAFLVFVLAGCSFSPTVPTATFVPLPEATIALSPSPAAASPTISPATVTPTFTVIPTETVTLVPATTQAVACPVVTSISGSHGVVLVRPEDVLNIRSGAGAGNSIVGKYFSDSVMISVTGATTTSSDGATWVQVCDASGMVGWVNGKYLTEVETSGEFCGDTRVLTLLDNLQTAFANRNGDLLASQVSPTHGVDVWLWNSGNAINFDREHAHVVFESTYVHNWGTHPASGMETYGSFQELVLPELQDAFVSTAQRRCNDGDISSYSNTWPAIYANVNFYQVYRPGTEGVDMDWNAWLVGVEYVDGRPYLFSLIHFIWTP